LIQFFNFNGNLIFNWIYFSLSLFFLPSYLFISSSVATQLYFFLNRYYSFPQINYLIQSLNFIFHFLVAARLLSGTFDFLLLFSYDFWNFIHLLIKIPNFLFISSFFCFSLQHLEMLVMKSWMFNMDQLLELKQVLNLLLFTLCLWIR